MEVLESSNSQTLLTCHEVKAHLMSISNPPPLAQRVLKRLKKTDMVKGRDADTRVKKLMMELGRPVKMGGKWELKDAEIVQIVDLMPDNSPLLQVVIEDAETRYGEDGVDEMLNLIKRYKQG